MTNRIIMFSGGVGSWAAAKRVVERHGTKNLYLMFADTKIEDEDLYRFLKEGAENVGGELLWLAEGRDPWQVFKDVRYIGNSRIDPCSKHLKRDFLRKYIDKNFDPADTIIYLGIDWSEIHRLRKAKRHWHPWRVRAPMIGKPYLDKNQVLDWLRSEGIVPPRLYEMGFPHNNCGGFCVKAGMGNFVRLLENLPERYDYHARKEQEMQEYLGSPVTILKNTRKADREAAGKWQVNKTGERRFVIPPVVPLSLMDLRTRTLSEDEKLEIGGCGCFDEDELPVVVKQDCSITKRNCAGCNEKLGEPHLDGCELIEESGEEGDDEDY